MVLKRLYENGAEKKKRLKQEFINDKGNCCNYCQTTEGPFHIDHCIPTWYTGAKTTTIIFGSLGKEARERELLMCQVLCESCHLTKSRNEHMAWNAQKRLGKL